MRSSGTDGNSTSSTPTSVSAKPRNPCSKPWPRHTARWAMLATTIIIGDMNPAPTPADRGGQATPQDHAVRDGIEMLGLLDLTANLEGQPSHFPHQTDAAPSRIDVCYGDPTTIIRAEARYGPLPLGPTGHSPLHIRLTIPNLRPSPPEDEDQALPPPLKMPPLHDK